MPISTKIVTLTLGSRVPKGLLTTCGYHQQFYGKRQREEAEDRRILQRKKDCLTLGVPEDCNDEGVVRDAYLKLAKRHHPDVQNEEAGVEKFQEIDSAYKRFLKDFADFRHNRHKIEGEYGLYYQKQNEKTSQKEEDDDIDEEGPDIKHTAPQHRQYLNFGGVGFGTPFQREKQYNKFRRAKAAENLMDYRVQKLAESDGTEEKALAINQKASKKIKTGIGMDRLVEDLIQESMSRGDFDNLSGKGKPLNHSANSNPYVDFTTHKLNQVLIENGFAPEWILLEKEIRAEFSRLRRQLHTLRHKYDAILSPREESDWTQVLEKIKPDCDKLNSQILKFNLTVPSLHKQMVNFRLEIEARKALANFSPEMKENYGKLEETRKSAINSSNSSEESFVGMLLSIFKT